MSLTNFLPPNPVTPEPPQPTFEEDLRILLNKHSKETRSSTPDFILAKYLVSCLESFEDAEYRRRQWYGASDTWPTITPFPPNPQ